MKHLKNIIKMKTSALLHRYFDERPTQLWIGKFIVLAILAMLSILFTVMAVLIALLASVDASDLEDDQEQLATRTQRATDTAEYYRQLNS